MGIDVFDGPPVFLHKILRDLGGEDFWNSYGKVCTFRWNFQYNRFDSIKVHFAKLQPYDEFKQLNRYSLLWEFFNHPRFTTKVNALFDAKIVHSLSEPPNLPIIFQQRIELTSEQLLRFNLSHPEKRLRSG